MEDNFSRAATINDPTDRDKPATVKSAPTLKNQKREKIKFRASIRVGFGEKTVILCDKDNKKLVKYSVDGKYSEVWSKDLPQGVDVYSYKYLTPSLIICRDWNSDLTLTFNHDLQPQQTYTGRYGWLRGTIHDDRLLYVAEISERRWSVKIYQLPDHSHVGTISRQDQPFQRTWISVCCHPSTQWLALVCGYPHSLDIYDSAYNHMMHVHLPYSPCGVNAVAAVKDWIIITDCHSLHVHNWHGEELTAVTNNWGWTGTGSMG